jgi:LysW-gamma-L-lysine carboxypeptidase
MADSIITETSVGARLIAPVVPVAGVEGRRGRDESRPYGSMSSIELLTGLVAIPSVSGDEAAAVDWLCEVMDALGYRARIDGAGNAIGTLGAGEREVLLLGHIDTVPGEIPVRVEDGVLHGRGAVDAKGPLAAFVAAGARARLPEGVRLTVVGAVGEESFGSSGATWLRDGYPAPAAVVIGEPSGWDGLVLGYKGSLGLTATITRPLSHSAGPEATAPELAFRFWLRLSSWLARYNNGAAPGFETLDATLRAINSTHDGLHEWATLQATFRLPPGCDSSDVRAEVERFADEMSLDWQPNAEAYRSDRRSPLVAPFLAAIRAAGGTPRLKVKTGTSDMNVVAPAWRCPIVAYGPGDARYDHTPDEQLDLAEYERGVAVLADAVERIAARVTSDE